MHGYLFVNELILFYGNTVMAGEGLVVEAQIGPLEECPEKKWKAEKAMGEKGRARHWSHRLWNLHGDIVEACGQSTALLSHEADRQRLPGPDRALVQSDSQDMGQDRQGKGRHEGNQKGEDKTGTPSGDDGRDSSKA